jgi:hypothetical protein
MCRSAGTSGDRNTYRCRKGTSATGIRNCTFDRWGRGLAAPGRSWWARTHWFGGCRSRSGRIAWMGDDSLAVSTVLPVVLNELAVPLIPYLLGPDEHRLLLYSVVTSSLPVLGGEANHLVTPGGRAGPTRRRAPARRPPARQALEHHLPTPPPPRQRTAGRYVARGSLGRP